MATMSYDDDKIEELKEQLIAEGWQPPLAHYDIDPDEDKFGRWVRSLAPPITGGYGNRR